MFPEHVDRNFLDPPIIIVCTVSVDVKQHCRTNLLSRFFVVKVYSQHIGTCSVSIKQRGGILSMILWLQETRSVLSLAVNAHSQLAYRHVQHCDVTCQSNKGAGLSLRGFGKSCK